MTNNIKFLITPFGMYLSGDIHFYHGELSKTYFYINLVNHSKHQITYNKILQRLNIKCILEIDESP